MTESTKETKPCEFCGEETTMHKAGRASHKRNCDKNPDNIKAKVNEVSKDSGMPEIEDKALLERYKTAIAISEVTRKEAPQMFVDTNLSDERMELIKRFCPECIDPVYVPPGRDATEDEKLVAASKRRFAEWHPFFGAEKNAAVQTNRGYIPVINPDTRAQVVHNGDLLYKIRTEYVRQQKDAAAKKSNALSSKVDDKWSDVRAGEGTEIAHEYSESKEEMTIR